MSVFNRRYTVAVLLFVLLVLRLGVAGSGKASSNEENGNPFLSRFL